jgi:predicted transcriptional regulator
LARKALKIDIDTQIADSDLAFLKHRACILRAGGSSTSQIGTTLGVTKRMVRRWFEDEAMQKMVAEIRKDITSGAIQAITNNLIEAAELLMQNARAAYKEGAFSDSIRAAAEVLDRGGLSKVNKSESKVKSEQEHTFTGTEEFFDKFQALPVDTQREIAEHMAEVESLVEKAHHTG